MTTELTLYHCPHTRGTGVVALLEELQAPYTLSAMNMKQGENRQDAFLAVNPMGKVPALCDGDALITEQVAIYLYLADLFPAARLAPPPGDPLRGPYLRWMAFYGSSFEPAIIDRWMQRAPIERAYCGYGDFDTMFATLTGQLERGPYMLGETFTALDVLWGTSLGWMSAYDLLPRLPVIADYVERIKSRPATVAALGKDAALAAQQAAAVA